MRQFRLFFPILLVLNTTAMATVSINESRAPYDISGATASELRSQMNLLGPTTSSGQRFDAKTTWDISWHYNWHYDNRSQNPCYVTAAQVSEIIVHYMPNWANESSADPVLQEQWNMYITNLTIHEQGHSDNGKQAAADIERALLSTPQQTSCGALQAELDRRANEQIKIHQDWDAKYDADTSHGRTQGAVFPQN